MSENHGTEAMDTRGHTAKPKEDRYQRSATVNDAPEAETTNNKAVYRIALYMTTIVDAHAPTGNVIAHERPYTHN